MLDEIPDDFSTEDYTIVPPPDNIFFNDKLKKFARPFVEIVKEIIKLNNKGIFPEKFPTEESFVNYVKARYFFIAGFENALLSMSEIYNGTELNDKAKDTLGHLERFSCVANSQLGQLIKIGNQYGFNDETLKDFLKTLESKI